MVIIAVILQVRGRVATAAVTAGLVGYWSFDEGSGTAAGDGSGNANNGTLLNGATWEAPANCKVGGCLKLDGVNDYVNVPNASSLQVTGDITISLWIKPEAASAQQVLVHKSREFHLGHIETAAPNRIRWYHASQAASGYLTNSTAVGQWQHIVLVRTTATKQVKGYRNGALENTDSYTTNPTSSSNSVGIGGRYYGGEHFKGLIDEVRIYDRSLSEAEIASLFNQSPPPPDNTAPSTPTGLTATPVSPSHIDLSWNASSDNVGVTGYRVYRNGTQVGTAAGTFYQDTGLAPLTTYNYRVAAADAAGNLSPQSAQVSATTLAPDSTPPVISGITSSGVTANSAAISWTTNEPADTQVEYGTSTSYGQSTALNSSLVTSHSQSLTGLAAGTTYHYRVKSRDGAGNLATSSDQTFTTSTTAPTRQDIVIASGLSNLTTMAIAPDGRLFVALQGGSLRVIKNDSLLSTPFLTVSVTSNNERGLLGVAFDPNFATNRFVYIYYTASGSTVVNRVSRFRASSTNPDVAEAGSEVIILDNIPSQNGWHNGGAIQFGPDGKLYIAVGENHGSSNSQSMNTIAGKVLRINSDGSIPTDNPFYNTNTGVNRAIWAWGLRNPFTFDIQPGTGRLFINDVGENGWEEINEAWAGPNDGSNAGFNFGWPTTEGPTTDPRFKTPFHAYRQSGGPCALTGGAFYNPANINFPAEYVGDYFFVDYCAGWLRVIDLATKQVTDFLPTGAINDPVAVRVGDNGSLYYLERNGGSGRVHKITYLNSNQPPSIVSHPASVTVGVGQSATFSVTASGSAPLAYQWQRNGVDIPGATATSYTLSNAQTSDSGAQFRAEVTNTFGTVTSNAATLTVTSNRAPTATITQPAAGTLYRGGDAINYAGSATDPEQGSLPASAFTWRIDFHHETHTHPFIPDTSGATSGSFTIPTSGHNGADVWYRIHLTVTDSGGLTHSVFRDITPRKADITLATNPPGLQLTLDGQPHTAPYTFTGVVGIIQTMGVASPQTLNGRTYEFVSWSDGGAPTHSFAVPDTNTTYTATFVERTTTGGLVGRWSFDEGSGSTANDASGNGNHGSLTYGPQWFGGADCKFGGCLLFDGVDDYVRILNNAQLQITGDVTISVWIRPTGLGSIQSIVSKRYEFEVGHINSAAPFALNWSHKASGGTLVSGGLTTSTESGQWQHIVLVRNAATKQITGYKNGVLSVASSYTQDPAANTYNLNIGRNPAGNQRFKGYIDEVRLYNRALTAQEVQTLFQGGNP